MWTTKCIECNTDEYRKNIQFETDIYNINATKGKPIQSEINMAVIKEPALSKETGPTKEPAMILSCWFLCFFLVDLLFSTLNVVSYFCVLVRMFFEESFCGNSLEEC